MQETCGKCVQQQVNAQYKDMWLKEFYANSRFNINFNETSFKTVIKLTRDPLK